MILPDHNIPPVNRRENVRVRDRLQVAYRIVRTEDIAESDRPERFFPFIWNKYPQALPLEEVEENHSRLLHHIVELHRKLDILIETVSPERRAIVEVPHERDVCISASGMNLNLETHVIPGQIIILCIVLPFIPPATVFATGEVIRQEMSECASGEQSGFSTSVNFLNLKDDDRETLIRYIFKKQRDMLRDRALEKGEEMHTLSEENE